MGIDGSVLCSPMVCLLFIRLRMTIDRHYVQFSRPIYCVDPGMETAELLAVTILLIITDLHCLYFMLSYFCVGFMLPFSVKVTNVLSIGVQSLMY